MSIQDLDPYVRYGLPGGFAIVALAILSLGGRRRRAVRRRRRLRASRWFI